MGGFLPSTTLMGNQLKEVNTAGYNPGGHQLSLIVDPYLSHSIQFEALGFFFQTSLKVTWVPSRWLLACSYVRLLSVDTNDRNQWLGPLPWYHRWFPNDVIHSFIHPCIHAHWLITLPETKSSHLKMDGWKLEDYFPFFGMVCCQRLCWFQGG